MNDAAPRTRYPNSAILLHWLVLLLVVAAYACILLRVNYERGSDIREGLKAWHFMLGLSVLVRPFSALACVRLSGRRRRSHRHRRACFICCRLRRISQSISG
jgi:cytochrome b561